MGKIVRIGHLGLVERKDVDAAVDALAAALDRLGFKKPAAVGRLTTRMPRVLITDQIAEEGVDILRGEAEVDLRFGLTPAELLEQIAGYDAVVVRSETKVTADVIDAGRLQVVGRAGSGVDNIDVEAATRRGVIVVNAPEANTVAMAEHAIGLMLALARHIPEAQRSLQSNSWERSKFMGVELRGKTLGLIGLGRNGSEVARRARGPRDERDRLRPSGGAGALPGARGGTGDARSAAGRERLRIAAHHRAVGRPSAGRGRSWRC